MMNSQTKASRQARRLPVRRVKALIVGLVVLGLTGTVLFATLHEVAYPLAADNVPDLS